MSDEHETAKDCLHNLGAYLKLLEQERDVLRKENEQLRLECDAAWGSSKYNSFRAEKAEAQVRGLRQALEYVRDWSRTTSPEKLSDLAQKSLAKGDG